MISARLSAAAAAMDAELVGSDRPFHGVCTDSRSPVPEALFFALTGARFDGHEFAAQAIAGGAAAAVIERPCGEFTALRVADTSRALGDLARWWRRRFDLPVIGITGSNGKTTVKELLGRILTATGPVLVTRGNLNNHIGVPLTLFGLESDHRAAVIEMGANHAGEIAYLTTIAEPTVGLVTNAGPAHLEGFGDIAGVARAKGELFIGLAADGTAVVNADDTYASWWRKHSAAGRIVSFALREPAEIYASDLQRRDDGATRFTLHTPAGAATLHLPLPGEHNVMNALAAAAAAHAVGVPLDAIASGLANATGIGGRLRRARALGGAELIDDCYNANPASLRAALEVLARMDGEHWLVLGDMGELGDTAALDHRNAGTFARQSGVTRLYAVGDLCREAVEGFGAGARWFEDLEQLKDALRAALRPGVVVLVKASRAMRLERVVAAIEDDGAGLRAAGS